MSLSRQAKISVVVVALLLFGAAAASVAWNHLAKTTIGYTLRADKACLESYHQGSEGGHEAERTGEREGWSSGRIEQADRYAWADALEDQYRKIGALGDPPHNADRVEHWRELILVRVRLYRQIGDAWAAGDRLLARQAAYSLDYVVDRSDALIAPLPFLACGHRPGGEERSHPATNRFTVTFPLKASPYVTPGTRVYGYPDVVGRVVETSQDEAGVRTGITIDPDFMPRMPGMGLEVHKALKGPYPGMVLVRPHDNHPSTPSN